MRVMPGVLLRPSERNRFIDFIRAGPAGWLWPPTVAQGLDISQIRTGNRQHYKIDQTNILCRGY